MGFLEYAVSSELFRQRLDSWVQSVTRSHQRANPEHIYRFWAAWPDLAEQRAIAAFLGRETGRIDTLVAKKRELIERLQEKRVALISHAVTRGIPSTGSGQAKPIAKLKSSGLDWLGEIPAHWKCVRLRRRTRRIQTGSTPPTSEDRYYDDGTVAWFGPGSFGNEIALTKPVKLLNASAAQEGAARLFRAGTIMVVTIGATLGKVSSLAAEASCNQQITAVEIDERLVVPRFAAYQLKRMETTLREIAPSATLPILDQGEIADLPFAEPPLPEQQAIADYLDAQTAKLDALVRKAENAIERLQEYRTALITATVTGKIDVSNYAHV